MGKKWNRIFPKPVHRAPVTTSCQKLTPAAFPLCLFEEILITRLRLRSVPRPLLKLIFLFIQRTVLWTLCIYHHFWLMLFTLTPHFCWLACHKRKGNNSPLQWHLPLSSPSVLKGVENQELPQLMLCFNKHLSRAVLLTVLQYPSNLFVEDWFVFPWCT